LLHTTLSFTPKKELASTRLDFNPLSNLGALVDGMGAVHLWMGAPYLWTAPRLRRAPHSIVNAPSSMSCRCDGHNDRRPQEETGETIRHVDRGPTSRARRRKPTDDGRGYAQSTNKEHSSSTRTKKVARVTTNVRKSRHHRPIGSRKKARTSIGINGEPSLDKIH
jgi:hypothetical protein